MTAIIPTVRLHGKIVGISNNNGINSATTTAYINKNTEEEMMNTNRKAKEILLRDGILTGNGDGEHSFNRARWEYDLVAENNMPECSKKIPSI